MLRAKKLSDFESSGMGEVHRDWDAQRVLKESSADSVLEVTWTNLEDGQPGLSHVQEGLSAGKNVITTNKGPAVFEYAKLNDLAKKNNARFMIEGTVMAGTPIVSFLEKTMPAADIYEVQGLLNGTCNYILSEMENQGLPFEVALKNAQDLGFAEADPTLDIGGGDARAKAIILTHLLGKNYPMEKVTCEGITGVTLDMIEKAKAEKKRWKLITQIKMDSDGQVEKCGVEPMCLDIATSPLANIGGALNALQFRTDMLGPDLTIVGPGAGKIETGYSLFTDLMTVAGKC
jgi:homoserine dehydrogenase